MVQRIVAVTYVQGVAVSQERLSSLCLDVVTENLRILLTQKRHISELPKVKLHCDKFILKVNLVNSCFCD